MREYLLPRDSGCLYSGTTLFTSSIVFVVIPSPKSLSINLNTSSIEDRLNKSLTNTKQLPLLLVSAKSIKDRFPYLLPIIKEGFVVDVYFTCEGNLYKGVFHKNGIFYSHGDECFASATGIFDGLNGKERNMICTYWCYSDEIKIN